MLRVPETVVKRRENGLVNQPSGANNHNIYVQNRSLRVERLTNVDNDKYLHLCVCCVLLMLFLFNMP